MPTFDITVNIYIYLLSIGLSLLLGFTTRSRQLAKKQRKILELEQEVVEANAEVLDSQRDYCELEARVKDVSKPVISMKNTKLEEPRPTGTH